MGWRRLFRGVGIVGGGASLLTLATMALVAGCSAPVRRIDPVFGIETPLLFAHRGGAREQPESTPMAFRYACNLPVDVLELDLQRTADGKFVVWHGPKLDNVRIRGENNEAASKRERRKIFEYSWSELQHAWVADPCHCCADCCSDLQHVPETSARGLMLFEDFLKAYPCAPINVELKKDSITVRDVGDFLAILDRERSPEVVAGCALREPTTPPTCERADPKVLIVSQSAALIEEVRAQSGERYATGEPAFWALGKVTRCVPLPMALKQLVLPVGNMRNRALQTSWSPLLSCQPLLSQVRQAGGASHVFLTGLLFPGLDACPGKVSQSDIDAVLNRGADGIMTDRPREVSKLLKKWKSMPIGAAADGRSGGDFPSCRPPERETGEVGELANGLEANLKGHVDVLAEQIGARSWRAPEGLGQAQAYIVDELAKSGRPVEVLTVHVQSIADAATTEFANVEMTVRGTSRPENLIVIGAHYDTDATNACGPTRGADDNASGVAALIELARYFSRRPMQRTLRFVAFTNEEEPFFSDREHEMGSWQYAETAHKKGEDVVAMISLETLGFYVSDKDSQHGVCLGRFVGLNLPDRGDFVSFVADSGSADELACALTGFRAYSSFPVEQVVLPEWLPGTKIDWSDHRSFWRHGYKGMMVTDTAPMRNAAYHKRWDTAASLNYAALSRVVIGMAGAIEALSGGARAEPALPSPANRASTPGSPTVRTDWPRTSDRNETRTCVELEG